MASLFVCAVRDRATDSFGSPICVPALGAATRSFSDEIRDPQSVISKHPEDYDLYHCGFFDTDTGVITPLERPAMVSIGKEAAPSSS